MAELEIFADEQRTIKIDDKVDFGIVKAGTTASKTLWLVNRTTSPMKVDVILNAGEDLVLTKSVEALQPLLATPIVFDVSPTKKQFKPVFGMLKVRYDYVIG